MESEVRTDPGPQSPAQQQTQAQQTQVQQTQAQQTQVQQTQAQQTQVQQPRDKFAEASADMMIHIADKVVALTRKPEFMDRLQTVLDPLINHIINRVFPYILLTSILFLILLLVSVTTFVIVVRGWLSAIRSVDRSLTTGLPDEWFPAATT